MYTYRCCVVDSHRRGFCCLLIWHLVCRSSKCDNGLGIDPSRCYMRMSFKTNHLLFSCHRRSRRRRDGNPACIGETRLTQKLARNIFSWWQKQRTIIIAKTHKTIVKRLERTTTFKWNKTRNNIQILNIKNTRCSMKLLILSACFSCFPRVIYKFE